MRNKILFGVLLILVISLRANAQYSTIAYVKITKSENSTSGLFADENSNEKSLIEYIIDAFETDKLALYHPPFNIGHEFDTNTKWGSNFISKDEFYGNMAYRVDSVMSKNPETGDFYLEAVETPYDILNIVEYNIIENRTYSADGKIINKQIVGFIPVIQYWDDFEEPSKRVVAGVYFSDLEPFVRNAEWYDFLVNCEYKGKVLEDLDQYYITSLDSSYFNLEFNIYPEYCPKYSFSKLNFNKSEYIPYPELDLSNVKYVKYIEEDVIFDDIENLVLFHPLDSVVFGTTNLINLMLDAIFRGEANAYKNVVNWTGYYEDNIVPKFDIKLSIPEIKKQLGENCDTIIDEDFETGELVKTPIMFEYNTSDIKKYRLVSYLYYDYNNQLIQKQIVGINPILLTYDVEEQPRYNKTFWIKFDEIAPILASQKVYKFNPYENRTFLDVLNNDVKTREYLPYDEYDAEYMGIDTAYLKNLYVNIEELKNQKSASKLDFKEKKQKKIKSAKIVTVKVEKNMNNLPLFMQYDFDLGYLGLFDYIFKGISEKNLPAYKTEKLLEKIDTTEIKKELGEHYEKMWDDYGEELTDETFLVPFSPKQITSFIFKELWLYNKKGEIIGKQILYICPISLYYDDDDVKEEKPKYKKTFWINYNDYDEYLKKYYVNKVAPVEDETFYKYLKTGKYKFEILEEEEISIDEAGGILDNFMFD